MQRPIFVRTVAKVCPRSARALVTSADSNGVCAARLGAARHFPSRAAAVGLVTARAPPQVIRAAAEKDRQRVQADSAGGLLYSDAPDVEQVALKYVEPVHGHSHNPLTNPHARKAVLFTALAAAALLLLVLWL